MTYQSWALPVLQSLRAAPQRPNTAPPQPVADAPTIVSPDRGCALQPRCLTCELPACVHDIVHARAQSVASYHRHRAIRALKASDPALTRHELSERSGCSQRTVSRAFQQEDAA